jgi:formate hydrogenlyase subunit 6/NADH:ubiquinone oxidoreductase subunit I
MPGMNKIVLSNLFKKPATRRYPFEKRASFEGGRGKMVFARMEDCIFCNICARNCPAKAITVDKASKTNTVDSLRCVLCGYCSDLCPKHVIDMIPEHYAPIYTHSIIASKQPDKPPAPEVPKEPVKTTA